MKPLRICLALFLTTTLHARLNFWTQINGMKYGPGYKDPFNFQARLPNLYRVPVPTPTDQWDSIWQSIPYLGVDIPPQELVAEFPFGYTVKPGDTTSLGLLEQRPRLSWPAKPNKLYTVMFFDHDSQSTIRVNSSGPQILLDKSQRDRVAPDEAQMFTFWVVTNIPGNNVEMGNEMFSYVPPLALQFENGKIDKNYPAHNSPLLVFEQPKKIYMEETARGCSQEGLGRVLLNPGRTGLAAKYGLKLVAGTFVRVPWSGKSTEQDLCRNSRCLGFPFPTGQPIPGVNDLPECQSRKDVMDVTIRGPTAGMEAIYGKYTSLYYPNSFINLIRSTYPVISNGVIREFRALEGEFRDGASLADTLDGEVNVAMLVYQSGEAAIQLFSGDSPQARKILGAALPALATQGDYKVLLVQPEDQDFDVSLVARSQGSLMEIEMVKVKEGQEERFTQLRNRYKARARSSSNVQDVQVFKVVQDTLEQLPEGNLFRFPAANNAFMLTFYQNSAARAAAQEENLKPEGYEATFDCIACTLVTNELASTYYPPYPADSTFPAYP